MCLVAGAGSRCHRRRCPPRDRRRDPSAANRSAACRSWAARVREYVMQKGRDHMAAPFRIPTWERLLRGGGGVLDQALRDAVLVQPVGAEANLTTFPFTIRPL